MGTVEIPIGRHTMMTIQLRRNRTLSFSIEGKAPENLKDLFQLSEEDKAIMADFDQRRKMVEQLIWQRIEALEAPPRDPLGQVVTRHTHEICWEPTGVEYKRSDGSAICEMRPYIQPIKSEYEK